MDNKVFAKKIEKEKLKNEFLNFDALKLGLAVGRGIQGWKTFIGFDILNEEWSVFFKDKAGRYPGLYEDYLYFVYDFEDLVDIDRKDVDLLLINPDYQEALIFQNFQLLKILNEILNSNQKEKQKEKQINLKEKNNKENNKKITKKTIKKRKRSDRVFRFLSSRLRKGGMN